MKVVAFLPVKGSSSRVENKNIKLLDGKPLFLKTLEKLISCSFIDEVYLDTDSDEIISLASELDTKILKRSADLATNETDGNSLLLNEVHSVEADIYVQILCTSPFIKEETIEEGVSFLIQNPEHDSAVLVRKEKQYQWNESKPSYDIDNIPNSIDLDDVIIETMGLYIIRREAALTLNRRIGSKPYFLYADPLEAVDVNWPEDFKFAEMIEAGIRETDQKLLNNIKQHLSSPMLSDIMDDLGISGVISGYKLNLPKQKIFGRAKTLKLRALKEGEDFRGIYKALSSYDTIVPNDIIIVENETNDYAYFGELNCSLAIRAGASGAIIGGKTRDGRHVAETGFPVFSTGYNCKDVRGRATLESINKMISINDIAIKANDLVFGDNEGIVIISKQYEKEVLKKAFEVVTKEKDILLKISQGMEAEELIKKFGAF